MQILTAIHFFFFSLGLTTIRSRPVASKVPTFENIELDRTWSPRVVVHTEQSVGPPLLDGLAATEHER